MNRSSRGDMIRLCAFNKTKWRGLQPKNQYRVPKGSVARITGKFTKYLHKPEIIYD